MTKSFFEMRLMLVGLACMISEQSPVKPEDAYDLVYLFLENTEYRLF